MNELRIADLEVVLRSWNYQEAVERTRPKVTAWSQATMELFRELYIAREALSRRGGTRDPNQPTWPDFCADIGYTRQAINAKLKYFVPAELSEDGRDCFLPPAVQPSKADREAASLARIAQFRSTGIRPPEWSDDDEALLRRLDAEDKAVQTAHQMTRNILSYKRQFRPARDYFTEMLSRERVKAVDKFRLADRRLRSAQQVAGDSIAQFLYSIDDLNDRAKAAANLVVRLRDIINDSIEEAVATQGAVAADDCDFEIMEA